MLMKRTICTLLAVCLTALALPCAASAKEAAVAVATPGTASAKAGDFTITGGKADTDYRYEDHVLYILTDTPLIISGTTVADRIRVEDGVNADITLAGVSIRLPDAGRVPAFEIAEGSKGNVTITLADGSVNVLKSGLWCAGLQKDGGGTVGTLTIRCGSANLSGHVCTTGCGSLTATGYWGAGIGSGASEDLKAHAAKNITITGGNIHASSVTHGAGIGAGSMGSAENIVIRGGIVEAAGGPMGVGIGDSAASHAVTISGGRVTATGGSASVSGGSGNTVYGIGGRLTTADASGKPGNAYIAASSLADKTGQQAWSGLILIGKEGRVWGSSVTLSYSAEIPEGAVVTVPEGTSLTVAAGAALSVKGKLRADGTIAGADRLSGTAVQYRLVVKNGEASGKMEDGYVCEGEKVTLVPKKSGSSGMVFAGWKCTPGDLKIVRNQFSMPASPVSVEAVYEREQTSYTEHDYGGWNYDRSGHWRECYDCGRRGWYGSHTFTSWTDSAGWRYERCTQCGYQVMFAASGSGGTAAVVPGSGGPAASAPGNAAPAAPAPGNTAPSVSAPANGGQGTAAAQESGTAAARPVESSGTNTQKGTAAETKPQKSTASADSSGGFWKDSGTGSAASDKKPELDPTASASDDRLSAPGTDPEDDDRVVVVMTSPAEPDIPTESAAAEPEGTFILERIPWWLWLIVFAAAAAAIIAFAVINGSASDDE